MMKIVPDDTAQNDNLENVMPLDKYQWWMDAIIGDDEDTIKETLSKRPTNLDLLLNGKFTLHFTDDSERTQPKFYKGLTSWNDFLEPDGTLQIAHPLFLAAVYESECAVELLYENGSNIFHTGKDGNNIIHTLVYAAAVNPEKEFDVIKMFKHICKLLPIKDLTALFLMKNDDGFKPGEYAAYKKRIDLFLALANTRNVCLVSEVNVGLLIHQRFDATDFVSLKTNFSGPLLTFLNIKGSDIALPSTKRLFDSPITKAWVTLNSLVMWPFIILAFATKLFYFIAYVFFETGCMWILLQPEKDSNLNNSQCVSEPEMKPCHWLVSPRYTESVNVFLSIHLILTSCCFMINYLVHVFLFCKSKIKGGKDKQGFSLFINDPFYTLADVIAILGIFILSSLTLAKINGHLNVFISPSVVNIIHLISSFLIIWEVLYYIQLFDFLGHFVIIVQLLLYDTLQICLFVMIFFGPTIQVLSDIVNGGSNELCVATWSSFEEIVYSVVKSIFHMVNFDAFCVQDRPGLIFTHSLYMFFVSVLLLNMAVAVFSSTVAHIYEHRQIILGIQRLKVVTQVAMICDVPFIRTLVERRQRKYFVCENGRIYMDIVVPFGSAPDGEISKMNGHDSE